MTRADEPLEPGEPLDLSVPAPAEPRPRPGGRARWWPALAVGLAAGVALGLVVADARDDAAGYADVRLVSGQFRSLTEHADETAPGSIELSLLNLGEHEVEILGLELDGMTVQPDEEPGEPVAAPPGEWVTAGQTGLIADCSGPEPGDGLRVRVRDGGGTERMVEADGLPDFGGASTAWHSVCRPPTLVFALVGAGGVTRDGDRITTELLVSTTGTEPLPVVRFESNTPGLVAAAPDVPFDVSADGATPVPLTWSVTDCTAALQWVDVELSYTAGLDDLQLDGLHVLSGRARAELVLLVDRVCEGEG